MNVPINKDLKLGEFFINGQKKAGDEKFFVYDPINANCQDFVMALLQGNNLGDKQIYDFVKQDTKGLVSDFMASVGKKITDVAGAVDRAVSGEGNQQKMIIKF